jgi:DNA-binding PadR family transcriptional regulator
MTKEKANGSPPVLPLKPVTFHVLLVLMDGERHGYGIVKEVEARTGDRFRIEPGNLYRTLRTMLSQGLIEESERRPDPSVDDQRRRYFRITGFGTDVARAEAACPEELVGLSRSHRLLTSPERGH